MATAALATVPVAETLDRRLSVPQIEARRSAISELMRKTMREDVDFGTIPGTPKPTLYKPGAEKICSLFQLAPRISVEDLSHRDTIRHRVKVELYSTTGVFCGEGVGEASSAETKYQWRGAICDEEYDNTPEDRRRVAYKRGSGGKVYTVAQVRTEPDDAANTVLKMAKKRALVDAVLTVTAASDIFTQDMEDPDNPPENGYDNGREPAPPQQRQQPQAQRPAARSTTPPAARTQPIAAATTRKRPNNPVSEAQARRFHAIATNAGKKDNEVKAHLFHTYGSEHASDLDRSVYDAACEWAAAKLPSVADNASSVRP